MFMCAVHQEGVNKLDLTWKQSFLILVDSKTLWTMLPVPVRIDTLNRPSTFTLQNQNQHTVNIFFKSTAVKHSL